MKVKVTDRRKFSSDGHLLQEDPAAQEEETQAAAEGSAPSPPEPPPEREESERFTRVDENTIHNEFTIEDPDTYTKPWTAVRSMPRLNDYEIYEYACHEGNYAMTNALTGARAEETAAASLSSRND